MSSDYELKDLANNLLLNDIDKERIIRILDYLGYLKNDIKLFDNLPDETLNQILSDVDCKSLLLTCKSSRRFANFCQKNLDQLLKQNLQKSIKYNIQTYDRQKLINMCYSINPSLIDLYTEVNEVNESKKNIVVDVSNLNSDGTGGQIISYLYDMFLGKGNVEDIKIVSDNYDKYKLAMDILDAYNHTATFSNYADEFYHMFGPERIYQMARVGPVGPVPPAMDNIHEGYKYVTNSINLVLDVSDFDDRGTVVVVPKTYLDPRKNQVDDIPIVSNNYSSYYDAIDVLTQEFGLYELIDAERKYAQLYGDT